MPNGYAVDRQWSDQFIPTIKRFIGPHLLEVSTYEVDTKQAADLIVLKANGVTIACRIRRPGYADKYPHEFTIRYRRDSGATTEYEKITRGWGDWMFYGHAADAVPGGIARWFLINLNHFRAQLITLESRRAIKFFDKANGDGTYFRAFDVRSFLADPPLLIAQGSFDGD